MNKTFKVFIVDDDDIYRQMIFDSIDDIIDLDIFSFSSGEDCISNLMHQPDIIILDHYLDKNNPEAKTGMQTLDIIQKRVPDAKVIVLSGQPLPDLIFDFLIKKEVYKYIVKTDEAFAELENAIHQIKLEALDEE